MAASDPELARAALKGLSRYQQAPSPPPPPPRREVARTGPATLLDCGGEGAGLILVPSLINPPSILDLDPHRSLAMALAGRRRVLLLDWGSARERAGLDLAGHVQKLLLPLIQAVGRSVLVGYCLGGTLALLAGARSDRVNAVATLAAPWRFSAYSAEARGHMKAMWDASSGAAEALGVLPMEVLQTAFWRLDPVRVVTKFARFAALAEGSAEAAAFVRIEDWANGGEPLPCPAARELVEDLFGRDLSGGGTWRGLPLPSCPMLHVTAANDRIVPAASAAPGPQLACPAGHVGMIAGRHSPRLLHAPLLSWLEGLEQGR